MGHDEPAAGAKRQTLDMGVLDEAGRRPIDDGLRQHRQIADGAPADLHRRRDVAFDQRRRHGQDTGDVVETVGGVVGRQQRLDVDLEREQVADRVRVLAAIEPVQRWRTRVRGDCRRGVEIGFEEASEPGQRLPVRPRLSGRRHHAGADLAHDRFPGLGVARGRAGIETVERQVAGTIDRVVAVDAVSIDQRATGGFRLGRRARPPDEPERGEQCGPDKAKQNPVQHFSLAICS